MNKVEGKPEQSPRKLHLSGRLDVLGSADEIVMVSGGPGEDEEGEDDVAEPVDVEPELVLVPGQHHDGGLQHHLHRTLGQHAQAVQDPGPGDVLELHEVALALAELVAVPDDQ